MSPSIESHLGVVSGGPGFSGKIISIDGHRVCFVLVPNDELLGSRNTLGLVVFTPYRSLGSTNGSCTGGACNCTPEGMHIHVGNATAVGYPAPSTNTTTIWACWHRRWDIIARNKLPGGFRSNGEHDKVVFVDRRDVGGVGDSESSSCCHGFVLGVEVGAGYALSVSSIQFFVGLTISPVRDFSTVVRVRGVSAVSGNLHAERATSGKLQEGVICWRLRKTAGISMHPVSTVAQLIHRVYSLLSVDIGPRGTTEAPHRRVKRRDMASNGLRKDESSSKGREHIDNEGFKNEGMEKRQSDFKGM